MSEAELRAAGSVETAAGTTLDVSVDGGATRLGRGESRVLVADLEARGAVVHLIGPPPQGHLTLLERVDFLPETSTFAALVRRAGLAERLGDPSAGPFTVFAPVEAAFDSLGVRGRTAVFEENALRAAVAPYQVSPEDVPSSAWVAGADFASLSGEPIRVRPNARTGDGRAVSQASRGPFVDLPAVNGRLHLMGGVLNPTLTMYDQLVLSRFAQFREVARIGGYRDLLSSGQPVTVFAPSGLLEQALRPGFQCRAAEIAGDHIVDRTVVVDPLLPPFFTDNGNYVTSRLPSAHAQLLHRHPY